MATVTQAYQFALDPTPRQRRALASHCGAARVAYNWGLQLVEARLQQRRAGKNVDLPWTLFQLQWEWNRAKQQVAPWWAENSKEAYKSGLDGLARALKNWTDSRAGRLKGRPVRFPHKKRKGRSRDACRFTTGAIKVLDDRTHIQLPRIGILKTMSPPASSLGESSRAAPASWPPPSAAPLTAGSSPLPSRSNGKTEVATARPMWWEWMSASAT